MPVIPHMGKPSYSGAECFASCDSIQGPASNPKRPNDCGSQLGWSAGQLRTPRFCFSHVVKKESHQQTWKGTFLGTGSALSDVEEGIFAFTRLHSYENERPLSQDLHLRQ